MITISPRQEEALSYLTGLQPSCEWRYLNRRTTLKDLGFGSSAGLTHMLARLAELGVIEYAGQNLFRVLVRLESGLICVEGPERPKSYPGYNTQKIHKERQQAKRKLISFAGYDGTETRAW